MIDKILNNLDYVFGAALIVLIAALGYGLGSQSQTNKLCKQVGGVYVQTWSDGYVCIMSTEITLK
jgi:hypothetical protein